MRKTPGKASRPAGRRAPSAAARPQGSAPSRKSRAPTKESTPRRRPTARPPRDVPFTHVDKVMFPDAGVTKGDLIDYYLKVADKLIPHLRDRPITLERMPDGVGAGSPRFWQKNTPPYYPQWIPRIELPSESGKKVQYALVNDAAALAYLVNQGAITFHPYLSRVGSLDHPDFVLFDLDPGGAKFADVVKIARALHDLFELEGVESFPKTSGKSGLHVLVTWRKSGGYDESRGWAMQIAHRVIDALPELATVERLKGEREGRVYIDVIQNALGHHAVPPYVVRATPEATVSTPLEWKEVTPKLDPKKFTVKTALKRFGKGSDPLSVLTEG